MPTEFAARNDYIEKRWAILGRILAGPDATTPAVAALAITGGTPLPEEPDDYGGPRLLEATDVIAIGRALDDLDDASIVDRHGGYDFTGLYGTEGSHPSGDAEMYVKAFHQLRDFYAESARQQAAMIIRLL
jgi:hypothetical protein